MKANPLACALLVLLAVAVQLPAQQPVSPSIKHTLPDFATLQPVTNAVATNKESGPWEDYQVSSSNTNAAATNKLASSKWQPPEGDEIIKGTKIPRWDDTTPLPAKTRTAASKPLTFSAEDFLDSPATANNSKKLKSKPRADEIDFVPDTETKPVIQEFPAKTPTPAKRSVYDFLRDPVELVDWEILGGVVFFVFLITTSVLILFRVFRQVFRYARRMKASMSKHNPQKIVLGLGLLLVILNGLFPPFEGEIKSSPMVTEYLGHYFLFAPPSPATVYHAITGKDTQSKYVADSGYGYIQEVPVTRDVLLRYSAHVVTSLFFMQFVTIVGAIVGACFLFGMRYKKGTGNSQEMPDKPAEP